MGIPVRIENRLYEQARVQAQIEHRTIAEQVGYWATIGRAALDNLDLPVTFIAVAAFLLAMPKNSRMIKSTKPVMA